MKYPDGHWLSLYPCCKVVSGAKKDAIYDLQRERHYLIPKSLTEIIHELKTSSIGDVINQHKDAKNSIIEYIDFLLNQDLAIATSEKNIQFEEIKEQYTSPLLITNAIIDRDGESTYRWSEVFKKLETVLCENIEIRWFKSLNQEELDTVLNYMDGSRLRDVELLWEYDPQWTLEAVLKLYNKYPRIKKVTLYGVPEKLSKTYIHEEITVIFTKQANIDKSSCGVVNRWYMLPKLELYVESISCNSCLNQKVGIDAQGQVKNCPSMPFSYGYIHDVDLFKLVKSDKFREMWHIKKDNIEVCKDCELRHMCQDCRAFINNPDNIYSKPSKCAYNPYE